MRSESNTSNSNAPHLKESIRLFNQQSRVNKIVTAPAMVHASQKLALKYSVDPKEPNKKDLEIVLLKFRAACLTSNWENIKGPDLRYAPYLFWLEEPFLARDEAFLKAYFERVSERCLVSDWRKIISVYLREFKKSDLFPLTFEYISGQIQAAFQNPKLSQRLDVWKNRHEKFKLFELEINKESFAKSFLQSKGNWNQYSELTGLSGELSQTGFVENVACELLEYKTRTDEELRILRDFHLKEGNLRFPAQRVQLIDWLLSHWESDKNEFSEQTREFVQNWLIRKFGDPRLQTKAEDGWRQVSKTSLNTMYRWLAGESLNQFFEIIDYKALEHQWKYRKAFWKAYYDKGYLNEAWVIFGPSTYKYAQQELKYKVAAGKVDLGTYKKEKEQSVLLIRIDDLLLAEWTHDGKCRAWRVGKPSAPEMYQQNYVKKQFMQGSLPMTEKGDEGIIHSGSEKYTWQTRLANFIYKETGFRVDHNDFKI